MVDYWVYLIKPKINRPTITRNGYKAASSGAVLFGRQPCRRGNLSWTYLWPWWHPKPWVETSPTVFSYVGCCPSSSAKLVPITPVSMVYGRYIYTYWKITSQLGIISKGFFLDYQRLTMWITFCSCFRIATPPTSIDPFWEALVFHSPVLQGMLFAKKFNYW